MKLSKIRLQNFKSIKDAEIELKDINILIGANGAGKSNFISFFEFLDEYKNGDRNFGKFIEKKGGASKFLFFGSKVSEYIYTHGVYGGNDYYIRFNYNANDFFTVTQTLAVARTYSDKKKFSNDIIEFADIVSLWKIYHFNDTSFYSGIKTNQGIDDNRFFRSDASNIAPFLYMLKKTKPIYFDRIVDYVKLVAPFFGGFLLEPLINNPETIKLEWNEVGSDMLFNAHDMSDGTLRFICLATLLLQPEPPETIIIDEPELGLHPYAISLLAEMIKKASVKSQIIISTQSVTLINHFSPEDIIVVDKEGMESKFRRVDKKDLADWTDDYSLGEIWEKNLIGGRP